MTIDDDRQYKTNGRVGAEIQFLAAMNAIPSPQSDDGPKPPPDAVMRAVREKAEHIKEHDTRYNQNKQDWEAIDTHRRGDGADEYKAKQRGAYAGHIMATERRTVRPYGVPDSEQKQAQRRAQKQASKQRKLDAMTPEQIERYRTEESAKRAARRTAAAKKV